MWKDANSNAVADDGELLSLADLGLEGLALNGYRTGAELKGKDNILYATTDAALKNGTDLKVGDVFLAYNSRSWDSGKGHDFDFSVTLAGARWGGDFDMASLHMA